MKYIVTVTDEQGIVLARSERPVSSIDLSEEIEQIANEAHDLIAATGRDLEDVLAEPEP